ncbi:aldehyde dehydrogenase (NADP(+)) [Cupriavidus metallidurans]|uniref:aldehyde dehydrogenase (NADP(+)) n=1 Tax=Cupriavidus metallidurans TaxID=119219 RepID=UPI0005679451|nr:aldehyde dehydrogenase (NADP(+)) [Cupriavidus metallidurans]
MHVSEQNPAFAIIDQHAARAHEASAVWAHSSPTVRSGVLHALADALDARADELAVMADEETGLGIPRLTGEIARTSFQLRGFAAEVVAGVPYVQVDDEAISGPPPSGRPRLTRVMVPIGPVAVFAASNFPFAFSVLGGDTASALAAGCPVIVKPHGGHPRLSIEVAKIAAEVLRAQGVGEGVFSMLDCDMSRDANIYLVKQPMIAGVAFTGSYQGGVALWRAANEREIPIPFFGELGSINPVVVLPAALHDDPVAPAKVLAASMLQGCGQFCTSPGVIVVVDDQRGREFVSALGDSLAGQATHRMLSEGIRNGFEDAAARIKANASIEVVQEGNEVGAGPAPRLFRTTSAAFIADAGLHEEMFGPAAVVVTVPSVDAIPDVLSAVKGSLTVTIWGAGQDNRENREIVRVAQNIGGRVLFSGVPTGVAVTRAQQHGGPWPASTDPKTTSVGYAALQRFLRPVALQDAPEWLLQRA